MESLTCPVCGATGFKNLNLHYAKSRCGKKRPRDPRDGDDDDDSDDEFDDTEEAEETDETERRSVTCDHCKGDAASKQIGRAHV